MTTLSDLTLAQLAIACGTISGTSINPKRFNSRKSGVLQLERLLVEKGLTTADALRAAGIEVVDSVAEPETKTTIEAQPCGILDEFDDDGYGCEVEMIEDGDIPGTEDPPEPGMVWDHEDQEWKSPPEPGMVWDRWNQKWEHPTQEPAQKPDAAEPAPDTAAPVASQADPEPTTPMPPTNRSACKDIAEALKPFAQLNIEHLAARPDDTIIFAINDTAITVGNVRCARAVLDTVVSRSASRTRSEAPRQPRTGTKQEILIALLRRSEGATIAQMVEATGWLSHTCRGALAGSLKKKLGLTITSTKEAGGERVYHAA